MISSRKERRSTMTKRWAVGLTVLALSGAFAAAQQKPDSGPPLANDLGPKEVDVAKYPDEMKENYKVLLQRCSKCHAAHRTFNAQYAQPEGDTAAQEAAIESLKKSNPDLFQDKFVLTIEADVWKRYVKRMMAKPGADIPKEDAKRIYEFLAYDSQVRKLKDPKAWGEARKKMLADFKAKHPEEFTKTYGSGR